MLTKDYTTGVIDTSDATGTPSLWKDFDVIQKRQRELSGEHQLFCHQYDAGKWSKVTGEGGSYFLRCALVHHDSIPHSPTRKIRMGYGEFVSLINTTMKTISRIRPKRFIFYWQEERRELDGVCICITWVHASPAHSSDVSIQCSLR